MARHRINLTPVATLVDSAPYRAGQKAVESQCIAIDRTLEQEAIEPATTDWSAPITFAQKKKGKLRFYVEYSRINPVTQRDFFPHTTDGRVHRLSWGIYYLLHIGYQQRILANGD